MSYFSFRHCVAVLCLLPLFLPFESLAQTEVRGRVIDQETQASIERVNLIFRRNGNTQGTSTGPEGKFQISLEPGQYVLEASALGYEGVRESVTVREGQATRIELELEPQEYSLNEIVVSDRRQQTGQATSTIERIEPAEIERQDAADVSELARLVPATHVQTNSRGQTILYFRNAGDRQVGQFFDGALLNIPWDNRVDISLVPASVVGEMTVAKGVPSVQYGANVLGGAINFQSRTLEEPGRKTELRGEAGTAAQRRGSVTHLGRTEKWDYTAALQYDAQGDQPLPGEVSLPYDQPDENRRINTDRQFVTGFARASRRFESGAELGVSALHVGAEQGVAPESNVPPPQTRYWRYPKWQKSKLILSGQAPLGSETSLRGAMWGSRFAQDINQYEDVSYDALEELQKDRDLTSGLRLIGTHRLPTGTLTLSLNGLTSRHHQTNVPYSGGSAGPDSTGTYHQHLFSVGAEYERALRSRMDLTIGGSLDGSAMPETGPFPEREPFYAWGLTSGLQVGLGEGFSARVSGGRKTRFPTMRELFGAALGKFVPNPDLKPVSAWIGEVSLQRQGTSWSVGTTAFLNRVYNTIDKRTFQAGPNAGKEQRVNLQGARVYGIETKARWQPSEALELNGHLTWSRPRSFTEEGIQKLDEKPAWLGAGTATYELPLGLSLVGQATYTGGTYARNEQNQFVRLPSSVILDARVAYEVSALGGIENGEVFARIDNLTDEAQYLQLGLPGPGRHYRVGLEVAL